MALYLFGIMKELKVGDNAPDFKLASVDGEIKLSDLKGKKVVLYFYPKDMTPGCTIEANNFSANYSKFKKKKVEILGVSPDSIEKHVKFIKKREIKFPLLSDEDHKVSEKYGVWGQKSMYGIKYIGVDRSTFIIDEKGVIKKIYRKVKVIGHVKDVLNNV